MQLPIAGLIAHLHAQFRKAQLKFSPRLSPTLIFSLEIDISKNIRWLNLQICYLFQQKGNFSPFQVEGLVEKTELNDEREKTSTQRNMPPLYTIKNRLLFALKRVIM